MELGQFEMCELFSYLDVKDVITCRRVCKIWKFFSEINELWKSLFDVYFKHHNVIYKCFKCSFKHHWNILKKIKDQIKKFESNEFKIIKKLPKIINPGICIYYKNGFIGMQLAKYSEICQNKYKTKNITVVNNFRENIRGFNLCTILYVYDDKPNKELFTTDIEMMFLRHMMRQNCRMYFIYYRLINVH